MRMHSEEQVRKGEVTVHWLGAAGLTIAAGDRCVLIDPYFSRLPLRRLVAGTPLPDTASIESAWQRLPAKVIAVVVGHTHIDHALDLPALARLTDAPLFGNASLDALLGRAGLPGRVTVCHPGHTHGLPPLGQLTIFAGAHGGVLFGRSPFLGEIETAGPYPLRARGYRAGDVLIFDLTVANRRFIHVGSAGAPVGMLPEGDCDALFLCVPGWSAQPDYPAACLRRLHPRRIVPIHFDRLTQPLCDACAVQPDRLMARLIDLPGFLARLHAVAPDTPVVLPRPWSPMEMD